MATYIRDNPDLERLGIGSPLKLDPLRIAENNYDGYLTVKVPRTDEEIRILHPWDCPYCGAYNWAEIVVRNGIIESISAVPLNRETLERSHLISNEAEFIAASLANVSSSEIET